MQILRFDETNVVSTDLNPIEDVLNFFTSLRSVGYTSDLLRRVHKFTDAKEIKTTSKLISLHTDNAVNLANQGLVGQAQTSFLPLYYSALNFSKIYLLVTGQRRELARNRRHGASYDEGQMKKDFLNEQVKIYNKGTIPLLYKTMLGQEISNQGCVHRINDIYKSIVTIGAEYETITRNDPELIFCVINIVQDNANGHYIKVDVNEANKNPIHPRSLKAFSELSLIVNPDHTFRYESKKIKGDFEQVKKNLIKKINRNLLSHFFIENSLLGLKWYSIVPISGKKYVFNEEINILLAFFHLSNIVRYNPEHLHKLMDSKYWAILLGLRKHGFLRFLKLMWGNVNKIIFETG